VPVADVEVLRDADGARSGRSRIVRRARGVLMRKVTGK
jgi:hypothetical protein